MRTRGGTELRHHHMEGKPNKVRNGSLNRMDRKVCEAGSLPSAR